MQHDLKTDNYIIQLVNKIVVSIFEEAIRLFIYKCFIKNHFDYCSLVWYQSGIANSKILKRIQEHALTFVYDDTT